MIPFINDEMFTLYQGDCLEVLRQLPDASVHCCVTSPPFYGLRDYGTGTWDGGNPDCDHLVRTDPKIESSTLGGGKNTTGHQREGFKGSCPRCGAIRVDKQIGLEQTPDEYVSKLVEVFREVHRVLRDDATLWLNLGDSYNNRNVSRQSSHQGGLGFDSDDLQKSWSELKAEGRTRMSIEDGDMKEKNLVGIPWMVAFALRADGWYLRSDIIWHKPNPMPESVRDRPTKSHEYIFLLSKSSRYFFDQDAVREPHSSTRWGGTTITQPPDTKYAEATASGFAGAAEALSRPGREWNAYPEGGRNIRSVWEIATQPYAQAHFATFPQALPSRCIKAGTSEHGVCSECGSPWKRETNVESKDVARHEDGHGAHCPPSHHVGQTPHRVGGFESVSTTTGWSPSCLCNASIVPATVLDIFAGAGTTNLVARSLGRRSIGIELNSDYVNLIAARLGQQTIF